MGLENARDSFVNLLEIKQDRQNSDSKLIKGTNAASCDDLCYEPVEVEEEDDEDWPTWDWELMGDLSQLQDEGEGGHDSAIEATASTESGLTLGSTASIYDCERIFTVPEVYEEIMKQEQPMRMLVMRDDEEGAGDGPCFNLFDCFSPWKQPTGLVNIPSNSSFDSAVSSNHSTEDRLNPKGAIKRSSMAVQIYLGIPASKRQSFTPSMFKLALDEDKDDEGQGGDVGPKKRRSIVGFDHNKLFAEGINEDNDDDKDPTKLDKKKYKVHFSELKRVLRIRKFNPEEALEIWFQREDFDYFKNEMTLLIQQDGANRQLAEAWLEKNEAQAKRYSSTGSMSEAEGDGAGQDGSGENNSHEGHSAKSWWHTYDHSRRGLERYASPGQAREILASNKVAIQKVLGEQNRQKLLGFFCVPRAHNPDLTAKVYHEYTAWSRDLALAAGASDADAVRTDFDDDKRHTREYYMLKQVVASGYKVHKHMPQFMLPKCITPTGYLNEAESLYLDKRKGLDGQIAGGHSLLESLMTRQSGKEAREEMSRLGSEDLDGPVPPSLLPSLQAKKEGAESKPPGTAAAQGKVKKKSMAAKAKNYPFQNE